MLRSSLLAATCGAGLALSAFLAVPAAAAAATPTSAACLNAEQSLNNAKVDLQKAKSQLAEDKAKGATKNEIDADKQAISQAQAAVDKAQANVNIECGTTPPVSHPKPVTYATCAAVHAAGLTEILRGQPGYRLGLDSDRDGVACETGTPVGTPTPVITYRYINGKHCKCTNDNCVPVIPTPAPVTVVQQPPSTVVQQAPTQVITVPAPQTVIEQPAPVYAAPAVPSGPVDTGDGSMAYLTQ